MERIETTILRNLIFDEEYSRKVIPFIQPDYFENKTEKTIFEETTQFIVKYDAAITIEALNIEPVSGRVIVFPPTWEYPHTGLPPKNDSKYIMSTYIHYGKN